MQVIDSHTEGEPTRVILNGGPDLGHGTLHEKANRLREEHRWIFQAILGEPRGHEAMVGALLVPADDPSCATGVIYFNSSDTLGMCGHATIGLVVSLAHLGHIAPGHHKIETPVGIVTADLLDQNTVTVTNVESYRYRSDVSVSVAELGTITGDVAWGGNWFFLTDFQTTLLQPHNIEQLTKVSKNIRFALHNQGITGKDGAEIDHIELCAPTKDPNTNGRNFVLCPNDAYDRSPCGTGSSAKLACLAADNKLSPKTIWVQESIISSRYELSYTPSSGNNIIATIKGHSYITAQSTLVFSKSDPFRKGILFQGDETSALIEAEV